MRFNIKALIKLGIEFPYFLCLVKHLGKKNRCKYSYIFGTPVHENMGDHLITYAEKEYLKDIKFQTSNLIEIPIEAYMLFADRLQSCIQSDETIFINGGGWMGNIWPNDEKLIDDMITRFKNNRIIIFPQTIYYDKSEPDYDKILRESIAALSSNENLTLCLRDENSLVFAQEKYLNVKSMLIPDITLSLYDNISQKEENRLKRVGLCLRSDREKSSDIHLINQWIEYYRAQDYSFKNVSTTVKVRVPAFCRKKALMKLLAEYQKCSVVITDRLHGMIFAYLTGTPCVVFDNLTRKISGVYSKWLKDAEGIYLISDNPENVWMKKESIVSNSKKGSKEIFFDFSELERAIIDGQD